MDILEIVIIIGTIGLFVCYIVEKICETIEDVSRFKYVTLNLKHIPTEYLKEILKNESKK